MPCEPRTSWASDGAARTRRFSIPRAYSMMPPMTDLLDKAVTTARGLPPEMQDAIARLMLAFVGDDPAVYPFPPDEAAELDASEAAAARGEFATDAEVRAIWTKHGL